MRDDDTPRHRGTESSFFASLCLGASVTDKDGSVIRIETPEHVVFEYELAGPASRVVAAMVDALLIGLGLLALFLPRSM